MFGLVDQSRRRCTWILDTQFQFGRSAGRWGAALLLRTERLDRNDVDAVFSDVAVRRGQHNGKERRFTSVLHVDATDELLQILRGVIGVDNAELHLDSAPALAGIHDRIHFAHVVPVVQHAPAVSLRIHSQIAHNQALEQEPEVVEILQ